MNEAWLPVGGFKFASQNTLLVMQNGIYLRSYCQTLDGMEFADVSPEERVNYRENLTFPSFVSQVTIPHFTHHEMPLNK